MKIWNRDNSYADWFVAPLRNSVEGLGRNWRIFNDQSESGYRRITALFSLAVWGGSFGSGGSCPHPRSGNRCGHESE